MAGQAGTTTSLIALPESTSTFDFTANLPSSFRQAGPRRRRTSTRPQGPINILEDKGGLAVDIGLTVLDRVPEEGVDGKRSSLRASRLSIVNKSVAEPIDGTRRSQEPKVELKKEPRRRTIYVPNEDTTILTVHPGMKHTTDDTTASSLAVDAVRFRRSRKSLAMAPKRAPLRTSLNPLQEAASPTDLPGMPTGKENIPPGLRDVSGLLKKPHISLAPQSKVVPQPLVRHSTAAPSSIYTMDKNPGLPTAATKARRPSTILQTKAGLHQARSSQHQSPWTSPDQASSKLSRPRISVPAALKYPVLHEDISQPQMFEDAWLSNQETVLTELVNRLFGSARGTCRAFESNTLREKLMTLYQDHSMVLVFKRLQASLQYGALSIPRERELAGDASRCATDVGIRKRFIHLWIQNYDIAVLRAAAEAVVGRSVVPASALHPSEESCDIEAFIESCLLRNEDVMGLNDRTSDPRSWAWRRTMQRCLMMILLIDTAKNSGVIATNIFRTRSVHKSSLAVLAELMSILHPSCGDAVRPLSHLHYTLKHTQYALSEYDYTIRNLAVDLRDGIRLTRLVELLLYPDKQLEERISTDTTITLPTGQTLRGSTNDKSFGVLSQHLKYPFVGKAPQLYNNQIAISALQGVSSVSGFIQDVSPEDIMHGHREKTLALLWGLVSHWGMHSLIDWQDVKEETQRLLPKSTIIVSIEEDTGEEERRIPATPSPRAQNRFLKEWASAIAVKSSLTMKNLTTSFADGKIFGCIVDEYQPYLTGSSTVSQSPKSLQAKLRTLGCSPSFGECSDPYRCLQFKYLIVRKHRFLATNARKVLHTFSLKVSPLLHSPSSARVF